MMARFLRLAVSTVGALIGLGVLALAAGAADQPPKESPCQKLTGVERTECERHVAEQAREPEQDPPEAPPPDTKSEGNEQSDTADPPQSQVGNS